MAIPSEILNDLTLPRALDITLRRGDTFGVQLVCETAAGVAINLDDATASAVVRDEIDGTILLTFSCVVTAASGIVTISALAADTELLSWPSNARDCDTSAKLGVWDVQLETATQAKTLATGTVYLTRDVTT